MNWKEFFKKYWLWIAIVFVIIIGVLFFYNKMQKDRNFCIQDDQCILYASCCTDYQCVNKNFIMCLMECGPEEIPPGPEPKCVCENYQCVRNLD